MRTTVDLLISIVVYIPDSVKLSHTLSSLVHAVGQAISCKKIRTVQLIIVDNGGCPDLEIELAMFRQLGEECHCSVLRGQGNIGFGQAHNLAASQVDSTWYLVLNPDVEMASNSLMEAIVFLEENSQVGLLSPSCKDGAGEKQFLCKRYPSLLTLVLRGVGSAWLQSLFQKRLAYYEMQDVCVDELKSQQVSIVSGCFMFLRRSVWCQSGEFSADFFVYFEDFDLSLRISRFSQVVYLPTIKITHQGGDTARKGFHHIKLFVQGARVFFNKHGWVI